MGNAAISCLVALALSALAVDIAEARRGGKIRFGGSAGGGHSYSANVLKPHELEACVLLDKELNERRPILEAELEAFRAAEDTMEKLRTRLDVEKIMADSSDLIDDYNSKVESFNRLVQKMQDRSAELDIQTTNLNSDADKYNDQCSSKKYYDNDMISIKAKHSIQ